MITRLIPNTYVVTLYLSRPYENFVSTSLRLVFVTHLYLLFTKFQMCALAGPMVPRRPLVAVPSYDERVFVWTLLIESGHIPLRTLLGNCCREPS